MAAQLLSRLSRYRHRRLACQPRLCDEERQPTRMMMMMVVTGTLYLSSPITPTMKKNHQSLPGRLRELRVPQLRLLALQRGLRHRSRHSHCWTFQRLAGRLSTP